MQQTIRKLLIILPLFSALAAPPAFAQRSHKTLVAVFAHPDDERIAGPLLARYGREGHRVYLVVATDGRKGVTAHAGIPPGDSLAGVRAAEARCATRELGIMPPILLGLEDGGLANFTALSRLRQELRRIFEEVKPNAVITFGPEGGTGHPDHRLVGDVVTEIVQRGGSGVPDRLFYPSLPTERMADAPAARPTMNTTALRHLRVRVPYSKRDFGAAHRSYACHASQYTREQVDANMRYLSHAFRGTVYLRSWHGDAPRNNVFDK